MKVRYHHRHDFQLEVYKKTVGSAATLGPVGELATLFRPLMDLADWKGTGWEEKGKTEGRDKTEKGKGKEGKEDRGRQMI